MKSNNSSNLSEFFNKKIVVTGASSGIGLSTSIYFLNCGAKVIMAGRDTESMKNICQKFDFSEAIIMKLDLKEEVKIMDFKTSVVERFGKIDYLINCAGVLLYGDVEKTFPQDFDFILDINIRSLYFLIYQLVGFMHKNSCIINMSCLYGTKPMSGMMSYAVSKAGIEGLTRYCAAEFASYGIRVNAISASSVNTNWFDYIQIPSKEKKVFLEKMEKNIPLGRIANPDDVVKVIAFLVSEKSKNITGQIIKVDGGRSLTSSGYVHYKGRINMNSRIEPDGESTFYKIKSFAQSFFKEETPKEEKEIEKYIEDKMSESVFSKKGESSYEINYTNVNKYITPKKNMDISQYIYSFNKSEQNE